ncbi:MAG: NADH-dependent [FeFe] hydrogenase, group A6 [Coprobacillaceae bacterium]
MADKVHVTINGREYEVKSDATVLEAAKQANIDVPTLCYLKEINEIGACRMCVVEVEGMRSLQASCVLPVRDGMVINTNSKRVRDSRKMNLELVLSNHVRDCYQCSRNNNCELRKLAGDMGIEDIRFETQPPVCEIDECNPSMVRNNAKCILCRRCIAVCKHVQKVEAIDATMRGINTSITGSFNRPIKDTECILCGQCINVCPTGALTEKTAIDKVMDAIDDPKKHVVVQIAPAVRAALGEEFGLPIGTNVTGKMPTAARTLGFDKVFDTNFSADLTIMEEGTELLNRINNNGKLPMITSCSPGWIKYCKHFHPDFVDNLSTCKSPHMMFGAVIKSHYAKKENIDPKDIVTVSIMPCVAKKYEAQREEFEVDGIRDVDHVITTREFAAMIKAASINFAKLEDETFDNFHGDSGAGVIFGATGGVMEAALRTVAEKLNGKPLDDIEFTAVRGDEGTKEVTVKAGDVTVYGLVISGVGNAKSILKSIAEAGGESKYHFIEVMGCPGGCIMGGGQPIVNPMVKEEINVFEKRASVLYNADKKASVRKSHENPDILSLYKEFLGEPNSKVAHKYLHTHHKPRERFGKID